MKVALERLRLIAMTPFGTSDDKKPTAAVKAFTLPCGEIVICSSWPAVYSVGFLYVSDSFSTSSMSGSGKSPILKRTSDVIRSAMSGFSFRKRREFSFP